MPYFGKWPFWFDLFIESCKCNPTIEWLFFSDCGRLDSFPSNVRYIEMSRDQCKSLILKQLDVKISSENPYKLCDIKPAYGQVFSEYIEDCDFFGFGDIDVVYGNIREFITESILEEYGLITTNDKRVNGHFCLLRNSLDMRTAFMSIK